MSASPAPALLTDFLPTDWRDAHLLGRMDFGQGPSPVLIKGGRLYDLSEQAPTVADLLNGLPDGALPDGGKDLGDIAALKLALAWGEPLPGGPALLAPIDLHCIKAAGVTFAVSALERVIEERARGDYAKANEIRSDLSARIGTDLRAVKPGSPEAASLKQALIADGLWSQYLEVAIGPDAEIFTKGPTLSSVGCGAHIGVRSDSDWNNPEPELALAVDGKGRVHGATLGNDVNLRDFEGRSALLLSKAKDNNASCALGPFIRLFDATFTLEDVRNAEVTVNVTGEDGFTLNGKSNMALISRDPLDLVGQTLSKNHQYPDGFVLFMGTLFAPIDDRDAPGKGFTHKKGDIVTIASPRLGSLSNKVVGCHEAPEWNFGIGDLMRNLARRGLLRA
ncbi:fumarylacetoacetate hydrolase [Niveispirillum lacus]|uniref:Fumarylacetoacetate hydrolase n=1 Tax=Niveispirillum lacus TaxID=1981099 RepID=A0A255Z3Z2_9PROT|nr:fumarylacetoacetate hydrolase family protein [Niveispirillum lacus]OYQ36233.1 fumarylacetoacetate hydrolase [Niveispirillum lacus]